MIGNSEKFVVYIEQSDISDSEGKQSLVIKSNSVQGYSGKSWVRYQVLIMKCVVFFLPLTMFSFQPQVWNKGEMCV